MRLNARALFSPVQAPRRADAGKPGSLYLCYAGIDEPLTQTQVVAYLEGLARAGYRIVLLTFEARGLTAAETQVWRTRLAARGIIWYWRRYHKRFSVAATAWDIVTGSGAGLYLAWLHRATVVHARSHVPGVMALAIQAVSGTKLLFDLRGFMAEEYVDAGTWPAGGAVYRATKLMERLLVRKADAIVILTERAAAQLQRWYPTETTGKCIHVIPCCVDLRGTWQRYGDGDKGIEDNRSIVIAYVGKLGGSYSTHDMIAFIATAREMIPGFRWRIWTQSPMEAMRRLLEERGLDECATVGRVEPELLAGELAQADAGLALYKRGRSDASRSPTKIGEYLAAGLPVICTAGIGDADDLLGGSGTGGPVGVLLHDFTRIGYQAAMHRLLVLLDDPTTSDRCRSVAERELSLETVGWPRYRQVYRMLTSG